MLTELGVHCDLLSEEEKESLDREGFLVLGPLLDKESLAAVRERLRELLESEGEDAGRELASSEFIRHPKEAGADRLANLVNKGKEFDLFYTHPKLLAGVSHILGQDFRLSSLNYRAARPGTGQQKLHVDWHEPVDPGSYLVCNSIWLLDDFTRENGATRIVPGSQNSNATPDMELNDPWASHPDEILLEAPAGTVVLFNAHVWHGGTKNQTKVPRRAIHSYFCRGDQPQQIDQASFLTNETRQRLSTSAVELLLGTQESK